MKKTIYFYPRLSKILIDFLKSNKNDITEVELNYMHEQYTVLEYIEKHNYLEIKMKLHNHPLITNIAEIKLNKKYDCDCVVLFDVDECGDIKLIFYNCNPIDIIDELLNNEIKKNSNNNKFS